MKHTRRTICLRLLGALLLIALLPLSPAGEETRAQLLLPQGETASCTRQIGEQWVLCLPIRLSLEGLNENLFLQSGQMELSYDETRLRYLGTGEQLLDDYPCTYADPVTGLSVKQGWVVNGSKKGLVSMAFASAYGCQVEENVLITLCFAFEEGARPGDELAFSLNKPLFTFADGEEKTVKAETLPCTETLTLSSQADRSALQAAYDKCYAAVYTESGEPAVSLGDTRDLTEGSMYLSSADLKADAAALSAARQVLTSAAASRKELDAALQALEKDFIFPVAHRLSYEELEGKIAIAEEKIASSEFGSYSVQLQKKWKTALDNARSLLTEEARPTNTQRKLDNAARAITELVKTGESGWILPVPVIMLLCAGALVVVLKKRQGLCREA